MTPRRLAILCTGAATAALAFAGLTLAQDLAPGAQGQAAPATAGPGPVAVTLPPEAAPPEEEAPTAPEAVNQAEIEIEPEPTPAPKAPAAPQKRPRFTAAVMQAVDKVTAETLRFEVKVGEPVRYKGLVITVHACEGTAAEEGYSDSLAHLEVQSEPQSLGRDTGSRVVYRGWMSGASPGLHPFEHSVYDVWLIACRTAAPSA